MDEIERLKFIEERDGKEAMLKFCEQGMYVYVVEALKRNPQLKESVEKYREVLVENGYLVSLVVAVKSL